VSDDEIRRVRAGHRTVDVHRPGKVLFPGEGKAKDYGKAKDDGNPKDHGKTPEYTKGDLVDYYRAAAPLMVPHLRGRPLMLERHPDGVDGPRFMQKNTPESYPDWICPGSGGSSCPTGWSSTSTRPTTTSPPCARRPGSSGTSSTGSGCRPP